MTDAPLVKSKQTSMRWSSLLGLPKRICPVQQGDRIDGPGHECLALSCEVQYWLSCNRGQVEGRVFVVLSAHIIIQDPSEDCAFLLR